MISSPHKLKKARFGGLDEAFSKVQSRNARTAMFENGIQKEKNDFLSKACS